MKNSIIQKPEVIIVCDGFYNGHFLLKCLAFGIILAIVMLNLNQMYRLFSTRTRVQIECRAPYIAIYQSSLYIFTIILPLVAEVLNKWNLVDWGLALREEEIDYSRRTIRFLMCYMRFSMTAIIPLRVTIIWFHWRRRNLRLKGAFWKYATDTITDQWKSLIIVIIVCLLLFVGIYGDGSKLPMWMDGFDWYDSKDVYYYKYFNITFIRVFEGIVGIGLISCLRYRLLLL